MNKILFNINSTTKIVINLEQSIKDIHCCTEASIILFHNNELFDLSTHPVRECIQDFKYMAEQLINNELSLHASITEDIGFLLNEELQFKPGLFQIVVNDAYSWIGYNYLLIMGYDTAVWLYNSNDEKIICEISPKFPFSYRNSAKDPFYIPYKKWIKKYKPHYIIQASRESIAEWIPLADDLLNQIQKNIDQKFKF